MAQVILDTGWQIEIRNRTIILPEGDLVGIDALSCMGMYRHNVLILLEV